MTEKLTPAELIKLAQQAKDHTELFEAVAPHWDEIKSAIGAMRHWPELRRNLLAAEKAPADLQAAFHRAVFEDMAKRRGQDAAFWGALALDIKSRKPLITRKRGSYTPEFLEKLERLTALVANDPRPAIELAALLDDDAHLVSRVRSGLALREAQAGRNSRIGPSKLAHWETMIGGTVAASSRATRPAVSH